MPLDEIISKLSSITGIDYVYFLDKELNLVKEQKVKGTNNYLQEILNIIKSESLFEKISKNFYSSSFHTYTFLNENGLIVILKLHNQADLYVVIIAGENEPVDLINLLKICKESRLNFEKAFI